jgi:hypothetical protein
MSASCFLTFSQIEALLCLVLFYAIMGIQARSVSMTVAYFDKGDVVLVQRHDCAAPLSSPMNILQAASYQRQVSSVSIAGRLWAGQPESQVFLLSITSTLILQPSLMCIGYWGCFCGSKVTGM